MDLFAFVFVPNAAESSRWITHKPMCIVKSSPLRKTNTASANGDVLVIVRH